MRPSRTSQIEDGPPFTWGEEHSCTRHLVVGRPRLYAGACGGDQHDYSARTAQSCDGAGVLPAEGLLSVLAACVPI